MNSIRNTMKLKKLIEGLNIKIAKGSKDIEIAGLSSNSKQVAPGFLYIAIRGKTHDGNQYVGDAILAGASAILSDLYNPFLEGVVQMITSDTKGLEAILAARFYDNPHEKLFLVGITGTNGKTTTSYLVKHLLQDCGLIGGVESIIGEHRIKSDLTTPDCITCYKLLKEMGSLKIPAAVMEVSSHALSQNRVDGIFYDVALFTNLTPEHLDYHADINSYAAEKAKLFRKLKKSGVAILNIDNPWAEVMKSENRVITYSTRQEADFSAKEIRMELSGTKFILSCFGKEVEIHLPLIGKFNVYNALAAIAVAYMRGIALTKIQERISNFQSVPGRMQAVACKEGSYVFVDFAHKTDALKNVLETLYELKKGKIITVFGCGGNRDREKRPEMAKVAENYSDIVIVTTDNPRKEDPEEIIREIQKGFQKKIYLIEIDRRKAIEKGLSLLNKGDTLLIAGKGHETNQIFAERSIFFDDVRVAEELANTVS